MRRPVLVARRNDGLLCSSQANARATTLATTRLAPRLMPSLSTPPTPRKSPWPKHFWTWVLVGAFLIAALTFTGSWVMRETTAQFAEQITTEAQGGRELRLPDGSTIVAGPDTDLSVGVYKRRRDVELRKGEAEFVVPYVYRTSFVVRVGTNDVTVLGSPQPIPDTTFSVRLTPTGFVVKAVEGGVRVNTSTAGPRENVDLKEGDMLTVNVTANHHELGRIEP